MLDNPTPCPTLSMAARRVYNRAKWCDSTVLLDPIAAAAEAAGRGACRQLAYDLADLRNTLSLKVAIQADHPCPTRAAQICALSEEVAALETLSGKLDATPVPTR